MKLFQARNLAILQLILYLIYILQGSLYARGSMISISALILVIIIGTTFLFRSFLLRRKQGFFVAWTLFLFINILYFILGQDYAHLDMLKSIMICSMGFFPFYYLGSVGQKFDRVFFYFLLGSMIAAILSFYNNEQSILLDNIIANEENIVNNVAYSFVWLIPFLFFIKKNLLVKVGFLLLIIFFIIQGAKRGAIITGGLGCIMYLYYFFKENPIRGFLKSIFMLSIIVAIGYYCYHIYEENEYLISRMTALSEGNSSGRDGIYRTLFHTWYNSDSILNILFGFGFASSATFTNGLYAHNDWLEVLSSFGILGILIYFSLFISLLKIYFSKEIIYRDKMVLLSLGVMWISTSLFSMWYSSSSTFTQSIILGYIVGYRNYYTNRKQKIK